MTGFVTLYDIGPAKVEVLLALNHLSRLAETVSDRGKARAIAKEIMELRRTLGAPRVVHIPESVWDSLRTWDCGRHGIFIDSDCPICSRQEERETVALRPAAYTIERVGDGEKKGTLT